MWYNVTEKGDVMLRKTQGLAASDAQKKKNVVFVDTRGESSFYYGHIPGAVCVTPKQLESFKFDESNNYVLYSRNEDGGRVLAEKIQKENVFYLEGGYSCWIKKSYEDLNSNEVKDKAELSIRKKFHKELFSKFAKGIKEYEMLEAGDKIAVCISGGKDSMLMAKLFQEIKKHNKYPFELEFLVMDPGYSKENREIIETNAKLLGIPITVFETSIFDSVVDIEKSPCYVCARMRRGYLYSKAKELGCNKIALGHHFDDVIETIMLGMLYGAQIQTMMPKLHSTNFEGMELIRPMYLIREEDIIKWRDYNGLHFIECACKFTAESEEDHTNVASKRKRVKQLIRELKQEDPQIEINIFRSVENINLSTVIAYKDRQGEHHFLNDYKNKK